jgi:hypothetical protein
MKTQKFMTCFSLPKTTRILITLGNEQCVKLLLGVCNTKKRGDLSLSLVKVINTILVRVLQAQQIACFNGTFCDF